MHVEIFYFIFPKGKICMKCQILFSGKNKKKDYQFVVCWISPESGKSYCIKSMLHEQSVKGLCIKNSFVGSFYFCYDLQYQLDEVLWKDILGKYLTFKNGVSL